jgi:hypothetical protein
VSTARPDSPALAWNWSHALLGATYALPGAGLTLIDPSRGLPLAVGVLPAVAFGLPGPRRARVTTLVLGALTGVSLLVGSLLAEVPVVAVPALFALCLGAAVAAPRSRAGQVALTACIPIVGIGLSYAGLDEGAGAALLMLVGSTYAYVVSLAWPARPAVVRPGRPAVGGRAMLGYGICLGLAAACAAAIGFALHLDHVGWACGAALLVMRPLPELLRMRGFDRVASVLIGAAAGAGLMVLAPTPPAIAVALVIALATAAGSHGSRRYVTPAFTTFVVFL